MIETEVALVWTVFDAGDHACYDIIYYICMGLVMIEIHAPTMLRVVFCCHHVQYSTFLALGHRSRNTPI
jgi:hypothetical protein